MSKYNIYNEKSPNLYTDHCRLSVAMVTLQYNCKFFFQPLQNVIIDICSKGPLNAYNKIALTMGSCFFTLSFSNEHEIHSGLFIETSWTDQFSQTKDSLDFYIIHLQKFFFSRLLHHLSAIHWALHSCPSLLKFTFAKNCFESCSNFSVFASFNNVESTQALT